MKYTIISFLLLVALTCTTARSIDAAEENVQEVREKHQTRMHSSVSLLMRMKKLGAHG
uniref:U22-Lycotoxin-Lsp1r_2 n=1 Tax=Lycosa sp. SGP-2016 TaxID=1905177 RepID=A0A482Z9I0_9ARAC